MLTQPIEVYEAPEYGYVDIPIESILDRGELDIDPSLTNKGFFDIQLKGRSLRLQAGGWVGRIPLNEWMVLDVKPRTPIVNLARILRVGEYAPRLLEAANRNYEVEPGHLPSIRGIYARALIEAMNPVEAHGVLREYRHHQRQTEAPRGRIVMGSSLTQRAALGGSRVVEASWFERSVDNLANRIIKYAIWSLALGFKSDGVSRKGDRALIRDLNRVFQMLEGVALDRSILSLVAQDPNIEKTVVVPTTRPYYTDPLRLAITVIRELALVLDRIGNSVRLPPLVVGMDIAFENYLRSLLLESEDQLLGVSVIDGNGPGAKLLFDELPSETANPDIVLGDKHLGGTRVRAVADVKYKPSRRGSRPARVDLNQVISYGVTYRAEKVLVIQPLSGQGEGGLVQLGKIDRLLVFQYLFNLGSNDLAVEERRFIEAVDLLTR